MIASRLGDFGVLAAAAVASAAGHVALFASMSEMPEPRRRPPAPIEMAVLTPEPPSPPAPAPPRSRPRLERRPAPVVERIVQPELATPAPSAPAALEPTAPPTFGVSLSSTAQGGAFRVAVGNTLMKAPEAVAKLETRPYVAPAGAVSKLPRRLGECVASYPPEAREQGREGQVLLDVDIDAGGEVSAVRVVRGLDPELDAAAAAALRSCRFSPAELGDAPVATRIRYTYTFVIEG